MKKIDPYFKLYNKKTDLWYNEVGIYPGYGFLVMNDNDAMSEISDCGDNDDWEWFLDEGEIDIEDLYFGCMVYDFNSKSLVPFNLFQSGRVLHSIAVYRTRPELGVEDPLRFCFGDLWGHVEYEMEVGGMFQDKYEKMSLWDMYVKPNSEYLLSLVNSVSVTSCERWLKDYRARTGR